MKLTEISLDDIARWARRKFELAAEIAEDNNSLAVNSAELRIRLVDIRNHQPMSLLFTVQEVATTLKMRLTTPDMEAASEVVQDLANFFKIWDLESKVSFPSLVTELAKINETIEQSNSLKIMFAANMSENINNLKGSIVRAEASHMIDDVEGIRRNYAAVIAENGALIAEYGMRSNNHVELLKSLKQLNNLIRLGAGLRVGESAKQLVAQCRDCIRSNKNKNLLQLITAGPV